MWRLCAVVLVVGCQGEQRAAEKTPPAPAPPPPVLALADAATVVDAALAIDAAMVIDAAVPIDAGVPSPPKGKQVERKGEGACKTDADCELSAWQEGCCTSACEGHAINKKLLAARKAKENCSFEKHVCPPPSPCPLPDFQPDKAICKAGTCTAVGTAVP